MSGMGAHRAEAEQIGRLSARCRAYEETIADLREQLERATNGENR